MTVKQYQTIKKILDIKAGDRIEVTHNDDTVYICEFIRDYDVLNTGWIEVKLMGMIASNKIEEIKDIIKLVSFRPVISNIRRKMLGI